PAAASAAGGRRSARGARVSDGDFGFEVFGERVDVFDESAGGVHAGGADALACAEFLEVAGEEAGDFDNRSAILAESGNGKRLNDGFVIRVLDGHGDRLVRVGSEAVVDLQQENAIALQLP